MLEEYWPLLRELSFLVYQIPFLSQTNEEQERHNQLMKINIGNQDGNQEIVSEKFTSEGNDNVGELFDFFQKLIEFLCLVN